MTLFALSEDLLRVLLEEWLTFEDFVALDTAACNKQFRKSLLRVAQQPLMTLHMGASTWETKTILDYASLRGVTPRQLTFNSNSPNMHDGIYSRTKALNGNDVVREFAETKTLLGGNRFPCVSQLALRQETPWFPPEDVEDEFMIDFGPFVSLVLDQFPSLRGLKLSLQDYGCLCETTLPHLHNLRVFHLGETYMATPSSFFNMITTLMDLPQLTDLYLMCGLHPECASEVGWDTTLQQALQLSESKRFTALVSLSGSMDAISLLLHLCPRLKALSLHLSKIFEENLYRKPLHHLSTYPFQLPLLTDFSMRGYNPCSEGDGNDVFNIEHLLRTAIHLRTFNASTLARHAYAINFEEWLRATRTTPLTSLRGITLYRNVIPQPFQPEWFVEMAHGLPNVTEFGFHAGRGNQHQHQHQHQQELTLSALKPIEAWTQLTTLKLSFFASSLNVPPLLLLDMGRFHRLETLHLLNIGAVLDDAYWVRVLSALHQLQEWVWQETMDGPCVSSVVCETIRVQCPRIRVIRGQNIWREINGQTLYRLAMSCRHLRELHVSLPSATAVDTVKATLAALMQRSPSSGEGDNHHHHQQKLFVLPEVTVSTMHRQSVM